MDWIMDWSFDCCQQSKSHKGIEEEKKLSMKHIVLKGGGWPHEVRNGRDMLLLVKIRVSRASYAHSSCCTQGVV
jgi:hypothetical protein